MILGCVLSCIGAAVAAEGGREAAGDQVYRTPEAFLEGAFSGEVPSARALWVDPALRDALVDGLGWEPGLRVRYWQTGTRTAWILEAIGKDRPITAGFVVTDGALERAEVLVFRESRGWEIRHEFFTRQFEHARLTRDDGLDRHIDGITGATLSVRAMQRMARVALKLHEHAERTTIARAP